MNPSTPSDDKTATSRARPRLQFICGELRKVLALSPRAFGLVWQAGPALTAAIFVINVVSAFFPIATLWMTKLVIDRIVALAQRGAAGAPLDLHPLGVLMVILGALWVANRSLETLGNTLSNLLRFQVEQHLQGLVINKCADLDVSFFEDSKNLDIVENATRGGTMSAWSLVWVLFSLVRTLVTLVTFLVALTRLHWLAMVVVAATTGPQMIASSYFARRRWQMMTERAQDSRLRFYVTWLMTQRDPAKEIRVFQLAPYLAERFGFYSRKFYRQEIGLEQRREIANLFLSLLGVAGAVGVWVYVALRAVAGTIRIGDVVLYTGAVSSCQGSLISLFTQGGQVFEQTLFLGNLFALLDIEPAAVGGALRGPEAGPRRWGDLPAPVGIQEGIEFRHVSFRYPGCEEWVLRDVSFHLRPTESVALVGRNGAGKTTLVKLLVRLYDPTEGEILLDGRNLRDYDLAALRRIFGVIFQDYTHYWLTLRENIGFGDIERVEDMEHIKRAAAMADVEGIAERLPQKYETYLARQFMGLGEDLSGGDWQKVALARAYVRDCPVVVLDEPTAALDAFAEREVYTSFDRMTAGRIAMFISHRFSTVRMAKHIIVLDEGRIVEEGSHDALLARGGLYAAMFETQAERYR